VVLARLGVRRGRPAVPLSASDRKEISDTRDPEDVRIVRFQRVFAAWRADPRSLARVAVECGYFDQSHLVRDFRDFAGAPPAGFLTALPPFTGFFLD